MSKVLRDNEVKTTLCAVLSLVLNRQLGKVVNLLLPILAYRRGTGNCENSNFGTLLLEHIDDRRRFLVDHDLMKHGSNRSEHLGIPG